MPPVFLTISVVAIAIAILLIVVAGGVSFARSLDREAPRRRRRGLIIAALLFLALAALSLILHIFLPL